MITRRDTPAPLVGAYPAESNFAESYRMLRTNVLLAGGAQPPRCIVVTSAERGEGKSLTSANLALVLARTDRRVALLDADLRLPTQHKLFGVARGERGFGESDLGSDGSLVTRQMIAERYAVSVADGLDVISAGPEPPDPSETVGSGRFRWFVAALLEQYDTVIIDSPPVGRVTDAAVLSALADGVLIVADFPGRRRDVRRAVQTLRRVDAPLLGVVLNRHDRDHRGSSYASAYAYSHA